MSNLRNAHVTLSILGVMGHYHDLDSPLIAIKLHDSIDVSPQAQQ